MAAANTFTWNSSTSANWATPADWTSIAGGAGAFTTAGATANDYLFILGAGGGTAYTVTVSSAITAGGVNITSSNAMLDITNTLKAAATATSAGYGGGAFSQTAGTVTMAGGTLTYVTYSISGGTFSGYGIIVDPAATSDTLATSGSGAITASGGTLLLEGLSGTNEELTVATNTSFDIASTGTLEFGDYLTLSGTTGTSGTNPTVNFGSAAGTMEVIGTYVSGTTGGLYSGTSTPFTFKAALDNLEIGHPNGSDSGASVIELLTGTVPTTAGTTIVGNNIDVVIGASTYIFDTNTTLTGDSLNWAANSGSTGYNFWVDTNPCYAAGTRIMTENGEVAVEDLAEGDRIVTLAGDTRKLQPVKWIGHRRVNLRQHPQPNLVAPVRVRQNAFGDEQPRRDLILSPDHCLFIDGMLVPVKLLINDMTVVQERDAAAVHYFHVELDRHSVILAENLPAESYLDTGNRATFANAGLAMVLHPEFQVNAGLKCWETDACAPLTVSADAVEPIWQGLAARAEALGYQRLLHEMTTDPELRLIADGRVIRPVSQADNRYVFALPVGVSSVGLTSRATVPSYLTPYLDDWRALGVAVRRIVVRDSLGLTEIPPDHPGLTRGWYRVERDDATMWRWMNGDAVVPMPETAGPVMLEVQVGIVMTHIVDDAAAEQERLAA